MQPKDQLRLAAQVLLPPHPPWGVEAWVSRRSGLRGSLSRQARPARAPGTGRWREAGGAGRCTDVRSRGWTWRAVQQAGSVFTVQWLPSGGEPLRGLPEKRWQSWREGGADARAGSPAWHPSQARQVPRAGLVSPLRLATSRGHLGKRRGCRPPPGCQQGPGRPRRPSLPGFWAAHLYGKSSRDAGPPCRSHVSLSRHKSLLVGVGIPWHQAVLWAQGLFHSSVPFLLSHILQASGSLAQVWLGGEWEEDTAPEAQRVLSRASQPSSSGWEPPGPMINISSVGWGWGILQPSPSQSRV